MTNREIFTLMLLLTIVIQGTVWTMQRPLGVLTYNTQVVSLKAFVSDQCCQGNCLLTNLGGYKELFSEGRENSFTMIGFNNSDKSLLLYYEQKPSPCLRLFRLMSQDELSRGRESFTDMNLHIALWAMCGITTAAILASTHDFPVGNIVRAIYRLGPIFAVLHYAAESYFSGVPSWPCEWKRGISWFFNRRYYQPVDIDESIQSKLITAHQRICTVNKPVLVELTECSRRLTAKLRNQAICVACGKEQHKQGNAPFPLTSKFFDSSPAECLVPVYYDSSVSPGLFPVLKRH